jgi:mono/diheme cytochrome c family protein
MSLRAAAASFALAGIAAAGLAWAQATAKPYASANVIAGKVLAEKDCVECHARKFDGDATRIYTRPDRRVRTPGQLLAQVQYCATELSLGYFPEDEADIAAFLDREHYKFAP